MTPPVPTGARVPPAAAEAILESLYQHRLLTTAQINLLHTPGRSIRWTRLILTQLHQRGLIARAGGPANHALWYVTGHGADTLEAISSRSERRRRIGTAEQAQGPLRAHTLAVNDVGIAFTKAARLWGDDCGPLSWRHEIAHPITAARPKHPAELLVADALLTYLQADGEQSIMLHQRFIELDRGTLPVEQLAGKLTRYARLREHRPHTRPGQPPAAPSWTRYYRAFPSVLIVLAGQTPAGARRRIQRTIALHATDPGRELHGTVPALFTTLADLTDRGPFAPVFISLHDPGQYVDWLGNPDAKEGQS
jgi:hypothetical protein